MRLMNLSLIGAIGATVMTLNPMTHLTQKSVQTSEEQLYSNAFYNQEIKDQYVQNSNYAYSDMSKEEILDKSKEVSKKLEQQEKILNSKKRYDKGTDKVEVNPFHAEIWVTKAYMGNVATILGVTGGSITGTVALLCLVMTLQGSLIAGPIGTLIGILLSIGYAGAVAYLMNTVNGYEVGGYFKVDFTVVFSWATAMATLRSQDAYESAPRLVPLHDSVNFHKKDSYDMKLDDNSKGIVRSYWDLNTSEKYIGVIDISKYTSYAQYEHIENITGSIAMRNKNHKQIALRYDLDLLDFLKDYYEDKDNDYLFWTIEKEDDEHFLFKLGGTQYIDGLKQHHKWISRHILSDVEIINVTIDLQIQLKK